VCIACAFWMIGEGLLGKKPVFNVSPLFGAKYDQLVGVGFEVMHAR